MQLQALITAEELPIHLHIRGQSERAALRKLLPRNLQSLSSGGGHGHIRTPALSSELSFSCMRAHTEPRTLTREHTGAGCLSAWVFEQFNEASFQQSE